jgi:hypothetical protein
MRPTHSTNVIARTAAARRRIVPFLLLAVISLLLGLWAGLLRIGWESPWGDSDLALRHGGLMVVGFVGTVIAAERAVAMQTPVAFAAPALSASAGLALVIGIPGPIAPMLATAAAAAHSANTARLLNTHARLTASVSLAGGLCLTVAGVVWWADGALGRVLPWWMVFLVLTIAAERLEIIRFQRFSTADVLAGRGLLLVLLLAPAVVLVDPASGPRLLGAGLILAPLWLVRRDIALHTVRTTGVARFAAIGVLAAYAWLVASGVLLVIWGFGEYDAVVHAFFIGFVFGAIIAHEPIIAPAVTGLRFAYTPLSYVPLAALDGALVMRIVADLADANEARRWAGMIQVLAILLFLLLTAGSALMGRRQSAPPV